MLLSSCGPAAAVPTLLIVAFVSLKLMTDCPSIPLRPMFWMFIWSSETFCALVREMPLLTQFWIVPPELLLTLPESPLTTKLPVLPVAFRTIPFAAPLEEELRNTTLLGPIVVLLMLTAVPVVVVTDERPPRIATALAPLPLPPLNEIVGIDVYPDPELVIFTDTTTPATTVALAVAPLP